MARLKKKGKKKNNKFIVILASAALLFIVLTAAAGQFLSPVDRSDSGTVSVLITEGTGSGEIAKILKEKDLIKSETFFKIYLRIKGNRDDLKAGRYSFSKSMSVNEILSSLVEGSPRSTVRITIREGLDIYRISKYLEETGLFTAKEFEDEIRNNFDYYKERYKFLESVPKDRDLKLEGYLFGDTYEVYSDASPRDVIIKMLDNFDRIFKEEYYEKAKKMGFTVDQIVIMASIAERECILDKELEIVAGVFYNRLEKGMKFQSCATVQYLYREYRFDFTNKELSIDSPYNTYKYEGMPAGPISNFREAALIAALNPAKTKYLYFCSKDDGSGSSAFAETYSQHLKNVEKYLNDR